MLIDDPQASLLFLISALRAAKKRVTFSVFIVGNDKISKRIFNEVNKCHERGCKVVMYGRPELLIGDVEDSKDLLHPDITVLDPGHCSHTKLWIIDDLVISTDRNINVQYYGDDTKFKACDLVFTSKIIANEVHDYLVSCRRDLLRVSDAKYVLYLGRLGEFMTNLLSRERNMKIISCNFWPSWKLQKVIIENNHTVIATDQADTLHWLVQDAARTYLMFTGIPGRTWVSYDCFHYKLFITEKGVWQGSFNLDVISEIYAMEQMVYVKDPKVLKEVNEIYDRMMAKAYLINRIPIFPGTKVVDSLTEHILRIWKLATLEYRPIPKKKCKRGKKKRCAHTTC